MTRRFVEDARAKRYGDSRGSVGALIVSLRIHVSDGLIEPVGFDVYRPWHIGARDITE